MTSAVRHRTAHAGGVVHVADFGGSGPRLLLVHGLGSSHAAWLAAGPRLAGHGRVVAVDLPGFGLSPLGRRSASVQANRRALDTVIAEVLDGPAIVVGNSMGAVVAMLLAAASPARVAGLVLVCPGLRRPKGVHLEQPLTRMFGTMLLPVVGEAYLERRWARLGSAGIVDASLALCCADPARVDPEVRATMVEVLDEVHRTPRARMAYLEAARSLVPYAGSLQHHRDLTCSFDQPTLLVHGELDRLVPVAAARALAGRRPQWSFEVMAGVGHTPQLEAPGEFVEVVVRWMAGAGAAAAARAAT